MEGPTVYTLNYPQSRYPRNINNNIMRNGSSISRTAFMPPRILKRDTSSGVHTLPQQNFTIQQNSNSPPSSPQKQAFHFKDGVKNAPTSPNSLKNVPKQPHSLSWTQNALNQPFHPNFSNNAYQAEYLPQNIQKRPTPYQVRRTMDVDSKEFTPSVIQNPNSVESEQNSNDKSNCLLWSSLDFPASRVFCNALQNTSPRVAITDELKFKTAMKQQFN